MHYFRHCNKRTLERLIRFFLGATTHKDPRLQMLADRLASRQSEMVAFTIRSEDTATSEVLSTWLQYTPVAGIEEWQVRGERG